MCEVQDFDLLTCTTMTEPYVGQMAWRGNVPFGTWNHNAAPKRHLGTKTAR
jgi:hypothetical protein